MPKQDDLEHKAFQLIMKSGKMGILQSDMWRKLGATSRGGSRIAIKLENKGLIRRERELSNGRWTYRLFTKREPVSINSILGCPCLLCPESSRCGALSVVTPNECVKLTNWIFDLAKKVN